MHMLLSHRLVCRRTSQFLLRTFTSTSDANHFHPSISGFVSDLQQRQPCFAVSPNRVQVLHEPSRFYQTLLSMIERAESKIFLSSLYIGSGETHLIDALQGALMRSPNLQVHLQLDLNRSTRPGESSTAHLLLPLLQRFPTRLNVSLFRSPSLRGLMAKVVPPRFNEGWGTWHAKVYGVDDDVIISGANLNESYFTDRQDRYIHFSQEPELANYCFSFLKVVSSFSYRLALAESSSASLNKYSYRHEDYALHWPDPGTHPHHTHSKVNEALNLFQTHHRNRYDAQTSSHPSPQSTRDKVLLFPVIQAGQFGIREEELSLYLLFQHLHSHSQSSSRACPPLTPRQRPVMDLTSGYFGLYKAYQDLILCGTELDCRIVCASPKANGFYGSTGISGRIPEGYTYLEQRFMKAVALSARLWSSENSTVAANVSSLPIGTGVHLSEWSKDGWTYHAKGIWLSPSHDRPPILTLFGSTNLNSRSAEIDTELSFIMALPSQPSELAPRSTNNTPPIPRVEQATPVYGLRMELAKEISRIYEHAQEWKGGQRAVRWGTKIIVKLVGGML